MNKRNIIICGLYLLWVGGIAVLGVAYDWKAAGACWLISCCFGTAILMDNE